MIAELKQIAGQGHLGKDREAERQMTEDKRITITWLQDKIIIIRRVKVLGFAEIIIECIMPVQLKYCKLKTVE